MPEAGIPKEAARALDIINDLLGGTVEGVCLHGSAAAGGLRKTSDVDILAAVNQGLAEEARMALAGRLMAVSGKIGNTDAARPLEVIVVRRGDVVPWKYPPRREFIYGEWLRAGYERGAVPGSAYDPDLALIISQARQNSVTLSGPGAREMLDPVPAADIRKAIRDCIPGLARGLRGDERNVILTFARMWATAATGGFLTKDAAAGWAAQRLPAGQACMLEMAGNAYREGYEDKWDGLESNVEALAGIMIKKILSCLDT